MSRTKYVTVCECGYRKEYFYGICLPAGDWKYYKCVMCHREGKPKDVNKELFYSQEEYDGAFNKGYHKACDDNHILYGEDAERFLKETGLDKLR